MSVKNTISKRELAYLCGVSRSKVKQWCNVDFYAELVKIGYCKTQQIFTPKQTKFLLDNLIEYTEKPT